ncbi:MAG: LysM peptidoglycan-binding domain-containing protein [Pseudomonadota bacterium]
MAEDASPDPVLEQELEQVLPEPPTVVEPAGAEPGGLWQRVGAQLTWQDFNHVRIADERGELLRQRQYLDVISRRAHYYLYYIVEQVEARQMPIEIALLPVVESTLNPFADSPSSAAGLWQIMPATGKQLGLRQDWWYDGRRDLRDSTRAALDYLEELHAKFDGDWLLALAAYNSGKSRVMRSMRANRSRGQATDYWSLKLPRETREYVPRLYALSQIIADPERYGIDIPHVPNAPAFTVTATGGQLELARAAELADVEISVLRAYNPGQLRWATSPDARQELLLPVGSATQFEQGIASLGPDDRVRWQHYRIQRGDTLIGIARAFDTEVAMLQQVNGIRGSHIRAGDTLMIARGSAWADSLALAGTEAPTARDYRVKRGDSLYRIAGKFKVSISDIIAWNGLDPRAYLQPGQQLTLYVGGG